MTGNAFLKRLMFQLDFLSIEDQKAVLNFYEKRISAADTLLEEEEIVKNFGSPEKIAAKLKETLFEQDASENGETEKSEPVEEETVESEAVESEDCPQNAENDEGQSDADQEEMPSSDDGKTEEKEDLSDEENEEDDDDGIIFSRPLSVENTPEIIHSLENKEIEPLFGEKVIIADRQEPVEEIILEPTDEANGFTAEEIEMAKAETLEKAERFDAAEFSEEQDEALDSDGSDSEEEEDDAKEKESLPEEIAETDSPEETNDSESEEEKTQNDSEKTIVAVRFEEDLPEEEAEETEETKIGLFTKLFEKTNLNKGTVLFLTVLLSILASPLLILIFGGCIASYLLTLSVAILLAVLAFVIIAALVVGGVVELVYGFAMLFDTVSVALIEIGVGTVIFSFVTAISGIIYEFLFGLIPKAIRFITKKFVHLMKTLIAYLYGGKA